MADRPKKSEQGEVNEPEELAAESTVGDQETPTERQQEREQAIVDEPVAESEQRIAEAAAPAGPEASPADETAPAEPPSAADGDEDEEPAAPRVKPEIPGMDLEPDIVLEGEDALREDEEGDDETAADEAEDAFAQPIADAAIDLAAGARYRATGKRKTAVARVILKPGTGAYVINGRVLDEFFPRNTLQRTIRQPLEAVGYEERMDVVASMHGGGVSAQAGAPRPCGSRAPPGGRPPPRGGGQGPGLFAPGARPQG